MYFYILNTTSGEYEGGGYVPAGNVDACTVHVPDGCELIWSETPLAGGAA